MPDSNGKIRGVSVPHVPWHQSEPTCHDCGGAGFYDDADCAYCEGYGYLKQRTAWSQTQNPDGSLTRVYHEPAGDRTVILDPHATVEPLRTQKRPAG